MRGIRPERTTALYAATVLVGSVLIVLTSLNQPYHQNEWKQIQPYGDPDLGVAASGTRQPPLDPLLGALAQRAFGEGHLEQRVVPMVSGMLCLLVMACLLRRFAAGWVGVVALAFMATAPVFLRFSAYTRPYMLPTLLMLVCALAGTRWLETGRRRWLVLAVMGALALPLTRVPEPTVFLAASAAVLVVAGLRGAIPRGRSWLLAGSLLGALVTVGAYSAFALARATGAASDGETLLDLSPGRALARTPTGLREMWDHVLPLYGTWFGWWPLVLLVLVLSLALPTSRQQLLGTWYWLPLVLAPLAFLVAYHTVNAYPLDQRHYQIRFACFWVPPLVLAVAAVLNALGTDRRRPQVAGPGRLHGVVAPALAAALLLGQLPGTWRVLTENDAVDFEMAGRVLAERVPDDAVVIYDSAARAGGWRQPFPGRSRFLPEEPALPSTRRIADRQLRVPRDAPVYLLLLDSDCANSGSCDIPGLRWNGVVPGFEDVLRFDRFTLYAPAEGQRGGEGTIAALLALVDAFGEEWAVTDASAAARMLRDRDRADEAADLLRRVCGAHTGSGTAACREEVEGHGLGDLLDAPR